jgi:2-polyprenyl-3-methyl-5-hydroxy-6-metoxy-1,4-benzoquinol methylase
MPWKRLIEFNSNENKFEQWIYSNGTYEKTFDVEVTFGKPIDILSLKDNMISNFDSLAERTKTSRKNLFNQKLQKVCKCSVCGDDSINATKVLDVYNGVYCQCTQCSHCYVLYRPTKKQLDKFYSDNKEYQTTYTDKESLLTRIDQVVTPKAEYVIKQYEKIYGKKPKSILDVGAGSGHFVYACRQLGITADGIEISSYGRDFCKENFDITLYDTDFTESYEDFFNYDVITFWGVIEHVTDPIAMLKSAQKITSGRETLVLAEVPRWESLSTAIQTVTPETIIRHLDPLTHINFFTEESLATAFVKSGLNISSAWYFGMDIYELITQFTHRCSDPTFISKVKKYIPHLQEKLDQSRMCDSLVLVGTPNYHNF